MNRYLAQVDVSAAATCNAFIGTMDAHMATLILGLQIKRLGYVPPFASLSHMDMLYEGWTTEFVVRTRQPSMYVLCPPFTLLGLS